MVASRSQDCCLNLLNAFTSHFGIVQEDKKTTMNEHTDISPQWVKITTVAAVCDTTPQAVRGWVKKGLLRQAGTGQRLRFVTSESFDRFMKTHS